MSRAHAEGEPPLGEVIAYPRNGPTALRIALGAQLRRLREARGLSTEEAGYAIRGSHSKISRMENGRVGFKERDVADLLTLYGVRDADERTALLGLVHQANTPGWWHQYGDVLPDWFQVYIGLEQAASLIRTYEVQFVPGLLQTEDYARAVVRLGHPDATAEEIERRIRLRMTRQGRLHGTDPLRLWAVVDEAALRRPLGGPEVMRAQLRHLVEMTRLDHVTLQIVQFAAGGHAAAGGPFSILRFGEPTLSDVIYLEQLTSSLYLDKPADVDRYRQVMDRLSVDACHAGQTRGLLEEMLRRM
ncbi:Helix-turn-helix domain-containing protein [Thermomonospora echinospora]|uniref:Helix-turn-helix domain-containing protein n=1 Tax=Thermomonospora echinospora TaxID=1992 RepID=A0A1H6E5M9_9ACTN|nr:helix-turn-helix transcriptional regulator [Thermomonospora echinospora]SEG92553.1 Helix-turn-helix domain-containing protein [Thermomonospora echinospora]